MVVCAAVPTRNEDGSAGSLPVRSTVSSAASGCPAARQMSLRTCFAVDAVIPGKRKPLRWRASLRCNGMNRGGELGLPPPPRAGEGWGEGELVLVACPLPSPPPQAGEGIHRVGRRPFNQSSGPSLSRLASSAPTRFPRNVGKRPDSSRHAARTCRRSAVAGNPRRRAARDSLARSGR